MNGRLSRVEADPIIYDINDNIGRFYPNPFLVLGDHDSGHGVRMGELEGVGVVAIKPHANHDRARREEWILSTAQERGFETIEPITVVDGGLKSYLITERREGLTHLGQLDWSATVASPSLSSTLTPALNAAGQEIADRHNAGFTSMDTQVKNLVVDATGTHVLVDAEKIIIDEPAKHWARHADRDVSLVGLSALSRGLLHDRSASYRVGYLDAQVLEPYLEGLVPGDVVDASDERRDSIKSSWQQGIDYGPKSFWNIPQ